MTPLASDMRWNDLEDSQGKAWEIPSLLNRAIADRRNEETKPWDELWLRLYRDGTIFTASYAAVPMIVNAIEKPGPFAIDFFALPTWIEIARHEKASPSMPDHLAAEYHGAIKTLGTFADKYTDKDLEHPVLKKMARAVQLTVAGKITEAKKLIRS